MLAINGNLKYQLNLPQLDEQIAELTDGSKVRLDIVGPVDVRFERRINRSQATKVSCQSRNSFYCQETFETSKLVVCQDSFDGLVRIILDFGFWILENCPIPHFKIDRPLGTLLKQ